MQFVSLPEAIHWIEDGATLAISGNMDMSPMALIREVIRSAKHDLALLCAGAAAVNADLLIGSGAVRSVEFSQISMGEYGFAPHFRRRFEQGSIEGWEHACPTLAAALQAGAMGIPFIPVRGLIGTDYMRIRSDFLQITNPYDEKEQLAIVPAIRPDVALFHAYKADTSGNVLAHPAHNNRLLAQASRHTIVSVEEIVSPDELRMEKGSLIPSVYITAIVHQPSGARPTACPGYYSVDGGHIQMYLDASRSEEQFNLYLQENVL
ncbi:CoA transferase subunit A [Paenibacillus sp. NPDC056579]|uniref:CoA transferase subunit A n=1 Tax=Paenibacillus sp. NPDC056579 TaxID=3345871 RepID=UPI00368DC3F0